MAGASDASGLRVFLAVYFVVLAASITILPTGPLAAPDDLAWLRGALTAATGLSLLWLAPFPLTRRVRLAYLALALPQVLFGLRIAGEGGVAAGATLLVFAVATAMLPNLGSERRSPGQWPVYPLGAFTALAAALQGLATVAGDDRNSTILHAAGVPFEPYGLALAILGMAGFVLSLVGRGPHVLLVAAQGSAALLTVGLGVMSAVAVAPIYWVLNAPVYIRAVAQAASPWAVRMRVDWQSARARSTVTIATAAIAPLLVLVTLLFYGPDWALPMSMLQRQLLFGLVAFLVVAIVAGAVLIARRQTASLQQLARIVTTSPGELLGPPSPVGAISEVEALRAAIAGLYSELAGRNEALARANAAKDEFLGLVSHELKTPITTILASAALMSRTSDAARGDLLEDLEAEAEHLAAVVDNLLALARLDAGATPGSQPALLLRIAENETARMARREPERTFSVEGDAGVVVDAVPEQISMVVRNYLSNAVKYSPPGTPIDVRVTTEAGMAVLAVHDAGHGLAPDQAGRVFDAFYRSSEGASTTHGIGIGLTVCRRLVESFGGQVEVRLDGSGTEFRFTMPVVADEEDALEAGAREPLWSPTSSGWAGADLTETGAAAP